MPVYYFASDDESYPEMVAFRSKSARQRWLSRTDPCTQALPLLWPGRRFAVSVEEVQLHYYPREIKLLYNEPWEHLMYPELDLELWRLGIA